MSATSRGPHPTPPPRTFDLAGLMNRVCGDVVCLQQIIRLFLNESPGWLWQVRKAVAARDPRGVYCAGHLLVGTLSTFGAERSVAAARRLEALGRTEDLSDAPAALEELETAYCQLLEELQGLAA